jgi:hypothetical protein
MARRQHPGGDNGVKGRVVVRQALAEPCLDERAVDALPLRFGEHRRREIERVERGEPELGQRGAEKPGAGSRVEDLRVALEEACADCGDGTGGEIVLRACEVVVVDVRDALVLGSQLVEVACAVQAVDVDPPLADR